MNIKKISVRDLAILGVLLIAIAYFFLVYMPVKNQTAELEAKKAELTENMSVASTKIGDKRKMDTAVDETFAEDSDPTPIPEYSHINAVIAELNTILAPTISYNVSFGQDEINDGIARRTIAISFTAENYESAVEILSLIQDSDNQYLISGLSLNGNTIDMTQTCTASLSMICYEYVPNDDAA